MSDDRDYKRRQRFQPETVRAVDVLRRHAQFSLEEKHTRPISDSNPTSSPL